MFTVFVNGIEIATSNYIFVVRGVVEAAQERATVKGSVFDGPITIIKDGEDDWTSHFVEK